jgi:hypothetical protein
VWELVAAELPAPVDNTSSYLVFAGVVVGAIASIAIAVIQSRKSRTEPSPPAPSGGDGNGSGRLRERVAVVERDVGALNKAHDELEDAHDLLDRAHAKGQVCQDAIVRFLDREFPGWH